MEGRGGQVKLLAYVRGGTGFCWPMSEGGLDFVGLRKLTKLTNLRPTGRKF